MLGQHFLNIPPFLSPFLFQEGFCKFYRSASAAEQNSSMKTALYAAAGVGLAGLAFVAARKMSTDVLNVLIHVLLSFGTH